MRKRTRFTSSGLKVILQRKNTSYQVSNLKEIIPAPKQLLPVVQTLPIISCAISFTCGFTYSDSPTASGVRYHSSLHIFRYTMDFIRPTSLHGFKCQIHLMYCTRSRSTVSVFRFPSRRHVCPRFHERFDFMRSIHPRFHYVSFTHDFRLGSTNVFTAAPLAVSYIRFHSWFHEKFYSQVHNFVQLESLFQVYPFHHTV